ncbi:MAG: TatD family hydrolase [Solirubrobacteraceae bacterium]
MIDSHTHLHLCKQPEEQLLSAAREHGVQKLLTVGTDIDSCRLAVAAAERSPAMVWAAVGQHPTGADELDLEPLRELAGHPRVAAIGETGFDYHHDRAPRQAQRAAFQAHIALARHTGKPLVIHTRAADEDTLALLAAEAHGVRVLLHCFSMPARLAECIAAGYWISFAGNVTYGGEQLARASEQVPADRLLVETDAPYLTPVPLRGRRNEPASVVHTAQFVAGRRGVSYEQFEREVEAAAAELFAW